MHASHLLPHLAAFRITSVTQADDRLILDISPKTHTARCPMCSQRTSQIYSPYVRSAHDLPCCGVPLVLRLHARRFICRNRHCIRRIFCERVPTLVPPRCRRTAELTRVLTAIDSESIWPISA
jgi:transposase